MRHFEYVDEKSNKFWEIRRSETNVTVRFGKVDTDGQSQTKEFASVADAEKHLDKLVREKLKKGYVET